MKENLRQKLQLYAITDRTWLGEKSLAQAVEEAIRGGVTMVQLREKKLTGLDLEELALEVRRVCGKYGVPFIINDDPFLAQKVGADGVHLGASDMAVTEARELLGPDAIIGATAKTVEQAKRAETSGADYLGSGALFGSTTKRDAKFMSKELLKEITAAVQLPVVAIGGITAENAGQLADTGIAGLAVVSGIFAQPDIREAARRLADISSLNGSTGKAKLE